MIGTFISLFIKKNLKLENKNVLYVKKE